MLLPVYVTIDPGVRPVTQSGVLPLAANQVSGAGLHSASCTPHGGGGFHGLVFYTRARRPIPSRVLLKSLPSQHPVWQMEEILKGSISGF